MGGLSNQEQIDLLVDRLELDPTVSWSLNELLTRYMMSGLFASAQVDIAELTTTFATRAAVDTEVPYKVVLVNSTTHQWPATLPPLGNKIGYLFNSEFDAAAVQPPVNPGGTVLPLWDVHKDSIYAP